MDPAVKTKSHPHQESLYLERRDDPGYGLFWEMGLGKTKLLIDVASHLYLTGRIKLLLVVAPKSVYRNWLGQEIPPHMAAPYYGYNFHTRGRHKHRDELYREIIMSPAEMKSLGHGDKLLVVSTSYDAVVADRDDDSWITCHRCEGRGCGSAFITDPDGTSRPNRCTNGRLPALTADWLLKLVLMYPTMIVADESSAISNGKTERAKAIKRLALECPHRWVATGTPVAQSPNKIHSQLEMIYPNFWREKGMRNYEAFKKTFGVFANKRAGRQVFEQQVGYQNLDRLYRLISSVSHRLLKEDSTVKLPPKTYTVREFEMTEKQADLYDTLARQFTAEIEAEEADREASGNSLMVESSLAIVRLARLQQICCGYVVASETTRVVDPVARDLLLDEDEESSQLVLEDLVKERLPVSTEESDYAVAMAIQRARHLQNDARDRVSAPMLDAPVPIAITRTGVMTDLMPPDLNPRLQLCIGLLEEAVPTQKVIVWTRYKRDVDLIAAQCSRVFGEDSFVTYDGRTKHAMREVALTRFRDPQDPCRIFIANTSALSQGVTMTIAKLAIYYSNSFSLEKRLQSEDRNHRIGQDSPIQIIDLEAKMPEKPGRKTLTTVDLRIRTALRSKFDIAAQCMGDTLRDWIK